MADCTPKIPKYHLHKARNLAKVRIDGKDHYLGPHGSPESHEEYARLVAEWAARGKAPLPSEPDGSIAPDLTVAELILAYLIFAEGYYKKRGEGTSEFKNIKLALRPVRRLYGSMTASRRPARLVQLRAGLSQHFTCRNTGSVPSSSGLHAGRN